MKLSSVFFILSAGNNATNTYKAHTLISYNLSILIPFFCILSIIYLYIKWKKEYKRKIKADTDKIYKDKIKQLKNLLDNQQKTITYLKLHSKQTLDTYNQTITYYQSAIVGIHYYIDALQDKNLSQLNTQELNHFIDCYKEIDKRFFRWLERNQVQLTPREITICIFFRMGKEKQDIINILQCSDSSYRTIKNRIKNKLKINSSHYDIEYWIKRI